MKKFWFKMTKWDRDALTAAIETGFEAVYAPASLIKKVRELSKVKVISWDKSADLVLGQDVEEVLISSKSKEKDVEKFHGRLPVIIKNKEWTIIPLENLISKTKNLIQTVKDFNEAKTALQTLEVGADGILLESNDISEIKRMSQLIKESQNEKLKLVEAKIIKTEVLGIGDRVVVDTSSILNPGQGMLVGDSSKAMFLVYNENVKSPYCDPRPFRVNAGGIHAYVRLPEDKTKYLIELKSGMSVLIVDPKGNTEQAIVGRVKIEKRPLMLIKAKAQKQEFSLVMQNAETIRLTNTKGKPVSITKLKKGDKVLAFLQEAGTGRHFGQKIKETITEN